MASAADVPNRFDVVINGEGYLFADMQEEKASFGLTPVFVQRANVQGDYGDNQQSFWLTWTQKDWSKGEDQRYSRKDVEDTGSRYWRGDKINITTPGQVTIRENPEAITFAAAVRASTRRTSEIMVASSTNLYGVNAFGTIADRGAHGLGATPSPFGLASDDTNTFLTTLSAGTVGVRKWDGSAFSTFSATGADTLAFLNNTLYGLRLQATGDLIRYDTAGVASSLFTWQEADGTARTFADTVLYGFRMVPSGGKLLILRRDEAFSSAELWLFDGTAPTKVAEFPPNFVAWDLAVAQGVAFVSGTFISERSTAVERTQAIYYYANGTLDLLWKSGSIVVDSTGTYKYMPEMTAFRQGLAFTQPTGDTSEPALDPSTSKLMFYDPVSGSISCIATYTTGTNWPRLSTGHGFLLLTQNQTGGYVWPESESYVTSATATSSLIDFDSSLEKIFRGIMVEWEDDSTDTGATVDIAYRLNDLTGSYTTLQTGAVSGTEYMLSVAKARSISVKVTLNKGTSTYGPKLKRVSVRAVPAQPNYKRRTYVLNLGGRDHNQNIRLRDNTFHTKDGLQMAADLETAHATSSAFLVTDGLGSYTGVIEELETKLVRSQEGIALVRCRSV